jgi:hypothetical protein
MKGSSKISILVMAVSMIWFSPSWAAYPVITIDGDISDWAGMTPAFVDQVDDENPIANFTGTDLEELYLAWDATYLYVMMKLHDGNPKIDESTGYIFEILQTATQIHTPGDLVVGAASNGSGGWNAWVYKREAEGGSTIANYDNSYNYVGTGTGCLEWKVPLSDLGDLSNRYIRAYIHVFSMDVSDDNITNINVSFDQNGKFNGQGSISLDWWYVQQRNFEDGRELNQVNFALYDGAGQYLSEDEVQSFELYDPDGVQISPTSFSFSGLYKNLNGSYDGNNGSWYFPANFQRESGYSIKFEEELKGGAYHLIVTTKQGLRLEAYRDFGSAQPIPTINSDSVCKYTDQDNNLIWRWKIPSELFPSVSTSVRTWLDAYSPDDKFMAEVFIKVPTHMGLAFVPNAIVEQMKQMGGDSFKIGFHVRSNDNYHRYYTNNLSLDDIPECGSDIDGDNKTGLPEAIQALRVAAGMK